MLRSINRMNDLIPGVHAEGDILIGGQSIYAPNTDVVALRKRIGMVFQRPNPFPMSIFDNVAYGPRLHGTRNKRALAEIVEKSLRQAALWDEVKDILHQSGTALSGGQQQRLCIARCVAVQPDVILMDEPASALDPISTLKIEDLMRELRDAVHDRHRDAQSPAGGARQRYDGVHARQCGGVRPLGSHHRVRPDECALHAAAEMRAPRNTSPAVSGSVMRGDATGKHSAQ